MAVVRAFSLSGRTFNIGDTGTLRFPEGERQEITIAGIRMPDEIPAYYFQIIPRNK